MLLRARRQRRLSVALSKCREHPCVTKVLEGCIQCLEKAGYCNCIKCTHRLKACREHQLQVTPMAHTHTCWGKPEQLCSIYHGPHASAPPSAALRSPRVSTWRPQASLQAP